MLMAKCWSDLGMALHFQIGVWKPSVEGIYMQRMAYSFGKAISRVSTFGEEFERLRSNAEHKREQTDIYS